MAKKKGRNGKAADGKAAKAKATEAEEPKAPKADLPAAPARALRAGGSRGSAAQAGKAAEPKVSQAELDALRKPVEAAKGGLEKAQAEAKALAEKARALVAEAKDAYLACPSGAGRPAALAPYLSAPARGAGGQAGREACHKAGVACEYEPACRGVAHATAQAGAAGARTSPTCLPCLRAGGARPHRQARRAIPVSA